MGFEKHRSLEEVTVEEHELGSGELMEVVMGMSMTTTKV